ncbi:hypothetical protein ANN_00001 [Periplaneta americana]|uniref:Uncharacterized protein n=1 Tax=Periplaneta americana TaxID=6978 RepID=A0ABQ8TR59_PERAM|nr:hypothetical protein ANN_00001 [Periplaneta americana]
MKCGIKCFHSESIETRKWICLWIIQGVSGKIKVPESEPDLSRAVLSVSERMFASGHPVAIYVPVKYNFLSSSTDTQDSQDVSPLYKRVDLVQNTLCNGNKSSIDIKRYSSTYMLHTLTSSIDVSFSYNWTEDVNGLLQTFHEFGHWPLLLSPAIYNVTTWRNEVYQNLLFILNYKNSDLKKLQNDIYDIIQFQASILIHNPRGHFIVVVMGNSGTQEAARRIFHIFLQFNYFDSAVVMHSPNGTSINIFYPNNFCTLHPEAILFGTFVHNDDGGSLLIHKDFNKQQIEQNLTACCFEILPSDTDPFVIKKSGNSLGKRMGGLDLRLLEIVTNELKVSNKKCKEDSVHIITSNKMFHLSIERMYDLTTPYFTRSYKFFVLSAEMYPRWASLARVFTPLTWASLFGSIVFYSLAVRLLTTCKIKKDRNSYDGTVHCFLNIWCSFLGVAVDKLPLSTPLRVLFLSWVLYSLSVTTVFQTFAISYLVDPGKQHQIDTLEEILEKNYTLLFDDFNALLTYSSSYDIEDKSYIARRSVDALNVAFHTEHSAVLVNEDFFTYYSKSCAAQNSLLHTTSSVEKRSRCTSKW